MKSLFLGLLLATGVGAAQADATVQLLQPALVGLGQVGRTACVGGSFNADHSITGACHTAIAGACSGRGCQPVVTTTNYIATWNSVGEPTGVQACATVRRHGAQSDVTYLNGHSAADCVGVVFNPTGAVIVIDGMPLFYVTTDAITGAVLANSNTAGYLFLPSVQADAPGKFY
jgi:hypothetical protein